MAAGPGQAPQWCSAARHGGAARRFLSARHSRRGPTHCADHLDLQGATLSLSAKAVLAAARGASQSALSRLVTAARPVHPTWRSASPSRATRSRARATHRHPALRGTTFQCGPKCTSCTPTGESASLAQAAAPRAVAPAPPPRRRRFAVLLGLLLRLEPVTSLWYSGTDVQLAKSLVSRRRPSPLRPARTPLLPAL